MANKVLVTGGSGLVGNNIIRDLLRQGDTVRALVRPSTPIAPFDGLDVERVLGELNDAESVRKAVADNDVVVHAAGVVGIGWRFAGSMREINVGGTQNVVDATRHAGGRLVHISTVNALAVPAPGDPPATELTRFTGREVLADYVVTKLEADQSVTHAMTEGLSATIVYPGLVFGPYDWKPSSGRMMEAIANRFLPVTPSGGITISDARDIASTIATIVHGPPPHAHYIVAEHRITYYELWRKIASIIGTRPPIWQMRAPFRIVAGRLGDMWGKMTGVEPEINSAVLEMSHQFHYYDSRRAQEELGYRARPLEESLQDAWDWLRP